MIHEKLKPVSANSEKLRKQFRSKKILSQVEAIEKGEILTPDQMIDPTLLILKLKEREKKQTFRSQIAAILSLWSFYLEKYSLKID